MTATLILASESGIGPTLAIIVGVGMAAQWLAWRTQVPSIILLLTAGLVLGPVGGIINPDELLGPNLFSIVSLSVALILFEGGLDLPPRELRSTGTVVRRLISIGAVVTFVVSAYASTRLFDIGDRVAYVVAAVLIVTGPTVVGPLLRFVRPSGSSGAILRAEGILIDPIGATASLVAFEVAIRTDANDAITQVLTVIVMTLLIGFGFGLIGAWILDFSLGRFLIPDHLANPMALAIVVVAFVGSNSLQSESGLLTVTVMGIFLARRDSAAIRQLLEFQETLRTILISLLFILLAARIQPEQLSGVALPALLFLAVLVFVARPLSVLVSTVFTKTSWRERLFLMSMAPRGIVAASVSAIFAIRLEEANVEGAELIVPIVFLVIIGTIVVYGFGAGPIARKLGLADARLSGVLIVGAHRASRAFAKELKGLNVKSVMVDTNPYNVTRAIGAGLAARRMSILSEEAEHLLDLRGIGKLLALTSNDEVNALATGHFSRVFGRRETFQLAPNTRAGTAASSFNQEYLGRIIGIDGFSYAELDSLFDDGWRMRTARSDHRLTALVKDDDFRPIATFEGDELFFVCEGDKTPIRGMVVGMASPNGIDRIDTRLAQLAGSHRKRVSELA